MCKKNIELIEILSKTKEWVSNSKELNYADVYSKWTTKRELMEQLDRYIANVTSGSFDTEELWLLYAPTTGICEIVKSQSDFEIYLSISSEFDRWSNLTA